MTINSDLSNKQFQLLESLPPVFKDPFQFSYAQQLSIWKLSKAKSTVDDARCDWVQKITESNQALSNKNKFENETRKEVTALRKYILERESSVNLDQWTYGLLTGVPLTGTQKWSLHEKIIELKKSLSKISEHLTDLNNNIQMLEESLKQKETKFTLLSQEFQKLWEQETDSTVKMMFSTKSKEELYNQLSELKVSTQRIQMTSPSQNINISE